eukprot:sb/3465850/
MFTDIEKLLDTWSETLASCHVIYHRTAVYNRHVFTKLKEKLPSKHTIRPVPFSTYRPTLKETRRVFDLVTKIGKVFESEMDKEREIRRVKREQEDQDEGKNKIELPQVNPRSIPNSHLKKRTTDRTSTPDKQEEPEMSPSPEIEIPSPYSDLISTITTNNPSLFVLPPDLDLDFPLPPDNSTLLHSAARSPNPEFVKLLLDNSANPEMKDNTRKTPYEVATSKEVRDEFRRFWGRNPDKWDYRSAKIPTPLTLEMEEEQTRKKQDKRKAQRAAKAKKDKERKAATAEEKRREEDRLISEAQKLRMKTLTPRERCLLAAEGRLATQTRGHTSGSCENCGTGLDGLVPFERESWKYCSVNCVREHRLAQNS